MKQINVRVTDEFHRAIKTKASSEGKTITAVIKDLLKSWVKDVKEISDEKQAP